MADDGYVTVFRTTDLAEGELLAGMLEGEGIDARFHRVSASLLGAGPQIFETRVDVPVESEARARELLTDLAYVGAAEGQGAEAEPRDATPAPRRPWLAGVAFLIPGGGHFYARRPWTGLVLAGAIVCMYVAALGSGVRGGGELAGELGFGTFVALFLCDAIGGLRACRAENRGVHRQRPDQLLRGAVLVLLAIGAGLAFAAAAAAPRLLSARRLQRFVVGATPDALVVRNFDRDRRVLKVSHVRLYVGSDTWSRLYNIEAEGQPSVDVPAGGDATIPFTMPDDLRAACANPPAGDLGAAKAPYPDAECRIGFSLSAVDPDDLTSRIEAFGSCPLVEEVVPGGAECRLTLHRPSSPGLPPSGE
ncbi:MAG TPA: DUF2007 domain-containing protein [Polyangia bacterium]|jgi:hypothetical protein